MENNKFELETLNLRNVFLQDKINELRDENFLLHSQISSLKDEIFILKKTISHMNETLNHQNALKISCKILLKNI